MKFLIAEDHFLVREAIKNLLSEWSSEVQLTECSDAAGLWNVAAEKSPLDVILLDPQIAGLDAADGVARLRTFFPGARIGIISANLEPATMLELLRRGASGFIPRSATPAETLQALTVLASGGQYLPDPSAIASSKDDSASGGKLAEPGRERAIVRRLSPRQEEVLRLLADGHPNKTIARELGVSVGTVKTHLVQIFQILGVRNRTSAVLAAGSLHSGMLQ